MRFLFVCLALGGLVACSEEAENDASVVPPKEAGVDAEAGAAAGSGGMAGAGGTAGSAGTGGSAGGFKSPPSYSDALAFGDIEPFGVAVDSQHVYWSDQKGTGRIVSCRLDHCFDDLVVLAENVGHPRGIVADSKALYFTADMKIMSIAKDGSWQREESTKEYAPAWLTLSGDQLYWTDDAAGTVVTCNKLDCSNTRQVFATDQVMPGKIAVNETDVYWVASGGLRKCARQGCEGVPTVFASEGKPGGLALDSEHVFWATKDGVAISWCPVTGCGDAGDYLFENLGAAGTMVVSDGFLYFPEYLGGNVRVTSADGSGIQKPGGGGPKMAEDMVVTATTLYWTSPSEHMLMWVERK